MRREWPRLNSEKRLCLAHPFACPDSCRGGFSGVRVLDTDSSALPFGHFSTVHSNGTNKVIDTQGTFCYALSCIPKLILAEVPPLHPE